MRSLVPRELYAYTANRSPAVGRSCCSTKSGRSAVMFASIGGAGPSAATAGPPPPYPSSAVAAAAAPMSLKPAVSYASRANRCVTPPSKPCEHHTRTETSVRSPDVQLNGGSGLTGKRREIATALVPRKTKQKTTTNGPRAVSRPAARGRFDWGRPSGGVRNVCVSPKTIRCRPRRGREGFSFRAKRRLRTSGVFKSKRSDGRPRRVVPTNTSFGQSHRTVPRGFRARKIQFSYFKTVYEHLTRAFRQTRSASLCPSPLPLTTRL